MDNQWIIRGFSVDMDLSRFLFSTLLFLTNMDAVPPTYRKFLTVDIIVKEKIIILHSFL